MYSGFCNAETFEEAVQNIGLTQLVQQAVQNPTKSQSMLIAEAHKCQLQLDRLHEFKELLNRQEVDVESASHTAAEDVAIKKGAELDNALARLCEEKKLLPRLLQDLGLPRESTAPAPRAR